MSQELQEITDAEVQAFTLLEQADRLEIKNHDDRRQAEDFIQGTAKLEKVIMEEKDPICKETYALWKKQVARRDGAIEPVVSARKIVKQKCIAYDDEQERIRIAEQRRIEEVLRKQAEEEALAAAEAAEKAGEAELAEAIVSAPIEVPSVQVQRTAPAPSRLSAGREVWKVEIESLEMLIKAVADKRLPANCLLPNDRVLKDLARAGMALPGCKVKKEKA